MARIATLHDENGEIVYPQTIGEAILDGLVVYASGDPGNGSTASTTFSIYSDSGLTQSTTWSTVFEAFAHGIPVFLKYGTTTQYIYQVETAYFPSSGSGRVTWKSQTSTMYSYYATVAPTDSSATRYIQEIPRDALDWSSFNSTYTTSTSQASGLSTTWKNLYNFSVSSYPVGAKIAVIATLITSTSSSTDHYARIGYNSTYGYEANQVGIWAQNLTCMYSFTKVSGINTVYIQGRVSTNANSAWGYRAISWRIG